MSRQLVEVKRWLAGGWQEAGGRHSIRGWLSLRKVYIMTPFPPIFTHFLLTLLLYNNYSNYNMAFTNFTEDIDELLNILDNAAIANDSMDGLDFAELMYGEGPAETMNEGFD
jgi:hypothetical protein